MVEDSDAIRHALSRVQAIADAKRREVQLVADVGRALVTRGTLAEQLTRTAETVARALRASSVRIWLVDEDEQRLILVGGAGCLVAMPVMPMTSAEGGVARHGAPLVLEVGEGDPERGGTFAGLPLVVDGRVAGVLSIVAEETRVRSMWDLLAIIADQVALALARAR